MTQRILEGEKREIPAAVISAVCQHHSVSSQLPVLAESLAVDASSVPDLFAGQGQTTLPGMTRESWREAQGQDPSINRVVKLVESAQKPSFKTLSDEQPEVKLLLREWNKLELREGILYRRCFDRGDMIHQLVLPEQHKDRALQGLHDEVGHLGAERVLSLARARFYWPRMKESIEKKCQTCERCFRRKAQPQKAAPMVNIRTTYPLELVCMDYLSLEPDSHDTRNIWSSLTISQSLRWQCQQRIKRLGLSPRLCGRISLSTTASQVAFTVIREGTLSHAQSENCVR